MHSPAAPQGHLLYDCSAHFRLHWLGTKLREDAQGVQTRCPDAGNDYAVQVRVARGGSRTHRHRHTDKHSHTDTHAPPREQALPYIPCTRTGLQAAVGERYPFPLDGLFFVAKGAAHEAGPTPFVLIWKDASTSSFLFDGTRAGHTGPLPPLCATLQLGADGSLRLLDGTAPEGVGPTSADAAAAAQRSGRDLVTLAVSAVHVETGGEGLVAVEGATYRRQPSPAKTLPDSLSKLLFQHQLRTAPLTLERVLAVRAPRLLPPTPPPCLWGALPLTSATVSGGRPGGTGSEPSWRGGWARDGRRGGGRRVGASERERRP